MKRKQLALFTVSMRGKTPAGAGKGHWIKKAGKVHAVPTKPGFFTLCYEFDVGNIGPDAARRAQCSEHAAPVTCAWCLKVFQRYPHLRNERVSRETEAQARKEARTQARIQKAEAKAEQAISRAREAERILGPAIIHAEDDERDIRRRLAETISSFREAENQEDFNGEEQDVYPEAGTPQDQEGGPR